MPLAKYTEYKSVSLVGFGVELIDDDFIGSKADAPKRIKTFH